MGPIDIDTLLPHRGPMRLISEIISFDDQAAVTRAVVSHNWPLTDRQGADALVLIELVAQTAAVNNGWELLQHEGPGADHRGWIVGIKNASLFVEAIPIGTPVVTTSKNQFEYENFREVYGVAKIDAQVAAEVTLQLVRAQ